MAKKIFDDNAITITKIIIFTFIISSLFIDVSIRLQFLNCNMIKAAFLLFIIIIAFIDLQLAILTVILFLIINVSLNKDAYKKAMLDITPLSVMDVAKVASEHVDEKKIAPKLYNQHLNVDDAPDQHYSLDNDVDLYRESSLTNFPETVCTGHKSEEINNHIFDLNMDKRTHAYDEYIHMLTDPEKLKSVQDNKIRW
jgi:hypothetical protein